MKRYAKIRTGDHVHIIEVVTGKEELMTQYARAIAEGHPGAECVGAIAESSEDVYRRSGQVAAIVLSNARRWRYDERLHSCLFNLN